MDQLTKSEGRRMMKVAIYTRVSTANNGQDPTMQTRELREYAERRGWTVAGDCAADFFRQFEEFLGNALGRSPTH